MEIKDIKQCLNQIKESQEILKAIYTFFIKHNPQKADESFDMLLHSIVEYAKKGINQEFENLKIIDNNKIDLVKIEFFSRTDDLLYTMPQEKSSEAEFLAESIMESEPSFDYAKITYKNGEQKLIKGLFLD